MRTWSKSFNSFFVLLLLAGISSGCASSKGKSDEDKEASTLRLHLETQAGLLGSGKVKVIRTNPITIPIEKDPFLDEGFIRRAAVIQTRGGPAIAVEYTERGALRLQMATNSRPGRRIVVWSRWDEGRWLAAMQIHRGLDEGIIIFVPDATIEEMERIVRGLNNVAIKLGNQPKPPKPTKADEKSAKEEKAKHRQDTFGPTPPDGIWEP
jgi:hypothetical protein